MTYRDPWTIPSEEKTAEDWLVIAQQAENAGRMSDPQFIKDEYFALAKHYREIAATLAPRDDKATE